MVVNYFDIFRTCIGPTKANAIPVAYANAMLPATVTFEGFKSVAWRYAKIFKHLGNFQLPQLSTSRAFKRHKLLYPDTSCKLFRFTVFVRNYHA